MNRRNFLKGSSLVLPGLGFSASQCTASGLDAARWRTFELTTRVEVLNPSGVTRIWVPEAMIANSPFQRSAANRFECGDGTVTKFHNKTEGFGIIAAEFRTGVKPVLTVTSRVDTRDWSVNVSGRANAQTLNGSERIQFLRSTQMTPTDGIVKQTATQITQSAASDLEKARAIYEWIVENTYRNPKTRGCGTGNIRFMLESGDLGGKCADLNALFVGLARAAGLPARDVYGIRVAPSQMSCKSLGTSSANITKAQHCRAEVYIDGYAWVPVDPADVRKVMLEEPPGHRPLDDDLVQRTRKRLFGSWEMNWIAYNFAQDVVLPGSAEAPVHFLMYPQAETAGRRVDSLDPESFRYEITAREITTF
jgi:transglutaminase-like putative cysteine protease